MKHLFIVNPAAGKYNQSVDFTKKIAACCKPKGLDYETRISARKGDCTAIARAAAQTGEEYRIYACGGDGTLNEIINGVAGYPNVAVTHFPGGTGNDFIRIFSEPEAFSELEQLLDAEETQFDLISINEETYSLNICSMGVDARIAAEVAPFKRIPGISGHGAYNLSVVTNVIKGVHRPCEVEIDGKIIVGDQTLICICNGRCYGGGYRPVPEAMPDDGLLDVLLVRAVSRLTVAKIISKYKEGRYAEYPQYITHYRVPELTIRTPVESVINADGESLRAKEARFSISPHKLRFFYPRGLTYRNETDQSQDLPGEK